MHNNYYYLRQLSKALEHRLTGAVVSECFSQSKDELIIRFEVGTDSFFIRANLSVDLGCLSFRDDFARARKNSVDLLEPMIGRRVTGVRQYMNERSFALCLSETYRLLFKMHGNRANIVLFKEGEAVGLFRKNLVADLKIDLSNLDRVIDWSREHFFQHLENLQSVYFTFGRIVWRYLSERGFGALTADEKWNEIQNVLKLLEHPSYFITVIDEKPALSLLQLGDIRSTHRDPLEAANEYFFFSTQQWHFTRERNKVLGLLKSKLEAGKNYIKKNSQRLDEVLQDNHYKVWADLLMANLHVIDAGSEQVVLENFYDNQRPVAIKLRKDLSPQKTAETYYRKARNQHIEIEKLEKSISQKEAELAAIRRYINEIESAVDFKSLKEIEKYLPPESEKKQRRPLPYHEFYFRDYRIWVGKNAQANDVLTSKYAYKDDLWLHAKDVSGSHVLIKYQAGRPFPKDVIEYAASLAAFNSKRRNESLCPVIVTPKKFVRKRKGDPPGTVVVEREQIVMVEPLKSVDN